MITWICQCGAEFENDLELYMAHRADCEDGNA